MSVEVLNETEDPLDEQRLLRLVRFVLDQMRIHPLAELSVLLVDEAAMERLHVQWMDEPGPTDVLAFPMDELRSASPEEEPEPGLLGDVVLCPSVAATQAARAGHPVEHEMHILLTHGILHLLGYDHAEPDEEREMFRLQEDLVARFARSPVAGTGTSSAGTGAAAETDEPGRGASA
jgi:probable rRNA maturation factor